MRHFEVFADGTWCVFSSIPALLACAPAPVSFTQASPEVQCYGSPRHNVRYVLVDSVCHVYYKFVKEAFIKAPLIEA